MGLIQIGLLLSIVLIFLWTNPVAAYSLLIGGLIFILPNLYFAAYAFRYREAQAAVTVLKCFYRGEVGKFLLSGVGFSIAFTLVQPLEVLILFGAYIAMTIMNWIQLANSKYIN
jgi:ATP synthase protein I